MRDREAEEAQKARDPIGQPKRKKPSEVVGKSGARGLLGIEPEQE